MVKCQVATGGYGNIKITILITWLIILQTNSKNLIIEINRLIVDKVYYESIKKNLKIPVQTQKKNLKNTYHLNIVLKTTIIKIFSLLIVIIRRTHTMLIYRILHMRKIKDYIFYQLVVNIQMKEIFQKRLKLS